MDRSIPTANLEALQRSFARGEEAKRALLARPDMWTEQQLAAALGCDSTEIERRRAEHQLLGIDFGVPHGLRYPAWQAELAAESGTRAALFEVLRVLRETHALTALRFFTTPQGAIGGRAPLDALRAGEQRTVVAAARAWAEGDQGGG